MRSKSSSNNLKTSNKINSQLKSDPSSLELEPVWETAIHRNYKILSVIGVGAYGVVVKAKHGPSKKLVAIKHLAVEPKHKYSLVKVIREIEIMSYLNNQRARKSGMQNYFAGLQDLFSPIEELESNCVRNVFLVMKLQETTLSILLHSCKLQTQSIKTLLYNLLCALHYLHSSNIVHRDIKPSNILVDDSSRVMVCDFGISRTLPESVVGKHNG